jgi:GNAT superfamily N-acetyltransferase
MEIRALAPDDDRAAFQSGDDDLDRYFHQFAGQNQFRHQIGVTYVAVEGLRIHGYVTVAATQVEVDDLTPVLRRSFPGYPAPALRIARLATARQARGHGLGAALLRFVFGLALEMAEKYGCIGVAVDSKPDAVTFYEKLGFIRLGVIEGQSGIRPAPTPLFLSIKKIRDATRPSR